MRYLVTGCAGFIGSHLVDALLQRDAEVIGIDSMVPFYDLNLKRQNLARALAHPRFHFIEGDLTKMPLKPLLDDVDVVLHVAGQPGVRDSWGEQFEAYTRNNVLATERLLHAAVGSGIKRFVFSGSSSIYGDAPEMPWRESTCPQPRSPYAITKLAAEHLCRSYHLDFGVPTIVVRYFTVYGPRQRPDMAFHRFLKSALLDEPIPLFGSGQQTRDFTYISDIVAGTLAAAEAPDHAVGQVFNLGGGSRVVLLDLLEMLSEVVGKPVTIQRLGKQAGDVRHTWADISRSQAVLGYEPQVGLREGLAREFAWIRDVYDR
ncbi:MAG TPA: NAD-dependent epimerase/dehydratase family protein [Anaerolineae bacterium]|nr:NAD-dependent epimerase/dehydratase family protein [Anaerolineae bacterium]